MLVAAGVAAAAAGTGAGLAAPRAGGLTARSHAIVADAAKRLGVEPSALAGALRKAEEDQVDAAAAGQLTQTQGDALVAALASGQVPLLRFGFRRGLAGRGLARGLAAAVSYLAPTPVELRTQLAGGTSLAQLATAQGRSVDGLVDALVAAIEKRLDAAVAARRLSSAHRQRIESSLRQRVAALVNTTWPTRGGARLGRSSLWPLRAAPLARPASGR